MSYSELCIEERATIPVSFAQGMSVRQIADSWNTRLSKTLDWRMPLEVRAEVLKQSVGGPSTLQ